VKTSIPKESTFKKRVLSRLRKLSRIVTFTIQQASIRGTPDLLLCLNGRFVALELKRSSKAPATELQKYNVDRINKAGGYATLVYPENLEEVMTHLEEIANETKA
jgi:hypothetical protein